MTATIDPLSHYLHQDNAMWRAVAWAIPIEGGILAGAFARPGWPGLSIIVIGTSLLVSLSMYAWKCRRDRDANQEIIKRMAPPGFSLGVCTPLICTGRFWLCFGFGVMLLSNAFLLFLEIVILSGGALLKFAKTFLGAV